MRALIVSLATYTSAENRDKLDCVARHVDHLTVVSGEVPTMWRKMNTVNPAAGSRAYTLRILPCRFKWSWATRFLKGFSAVAARARPDVVHVEAEPWQVIALQSLAYARRRRIPIGIQFCEDGPRMEGIRGRVRQSIAAFVLKRCSYAIGWSSLSAGLARQLAPGVLVSSPMPGVGVPLWQTDPCAHDDPEERRRWFGDQSECTAKVAFIGRLVPEKGVGDMMCVCDALSQRMRLRIAILGTGPCADSVSAWARSRPWVTFHGLVRRADASRCLAAADVALMPSRSTNNWQEQFGRAAAEAMAAGTPVIGYKCGALPEVVGAAGSLVAEGDTGALEEELERYLRLAPLARSDSRARAKERGSSFTNEKLALRLVEVWREIGSFTEDSRLAPSLPSVAQRER